VKKENSIITVWPDATAMATAAANFIVLKSNEAVNDKGYFTIALSGGNTPAVLYNLLSKSPFKESIPWKKTIIFFSDERFVPHNNTDSNYKMIEDILLSKISIPKKNIIAFTTENISPEKSAIAYEAKLRKYITPQHPCDLILLGIGEDGHTASIFPKSILLKEKKRWVKEVFVAEKNMYRISFTLPLINKAANVAFLVSGENKAVILKKIISRQKEMLPASLVHPSGNLFWFLDAAAAGLIKK
jgi:6-phosphogluconolactonase